VAVQTTRKTSRARRASKSKTRRIPAWLKNSLARYFPVWLLASVIFLVNLPRILSFAAEATIDGLSALPGAAISVGGDALDIAWDGVQWTGDKIGDIFESDSHGNSAIAPLFTEEVDYWADDIADWADEYNLDPNLLATVMQIESCGHPTVNSSAGAQGLFQVMPFHFASDEDQLDPNTNAMRGAGVLNECLALANGDAGLAMACYNGGPSVIHAPINSWYAEPQRYYYWGTGIYSAAKDDQSSSARLDEWLNAGGSRLCDWAADELDMN
jgi:hypothetical protein